MNKTNGRRLLCLLVILSLALLCACGEKSETTTRQPQSETTAQRGGGGVNLAGGATTQAAETLPGGMVTGVVRPQNVHADGENSGPSIFGYWDNDEVMRSLTTYEDGTYVMTDTYSEWSGFYEYEEISGDFTMFHGEDIYFGRLEAHGNLVIFSISGEFVPVDQPFYMNQAGQTSGLEGFWHLHGDAHSTPYFYISHTDTWTYYNLDDVGDIVAYGSGYVISHGNGYFDLVDEYSGDVYTVYEFEPGGFLLGEALHFYHTGY